MSQPMPVEQSLRFQFDVSQGDFLASVGLDKAEAIMQELGQPIDAPLEHIFTPGLYTRKITMPKGALITSRIHKTRHPFVVMSGDVSVYIAGFGTERIRGPYQGITQPGTRRLLYCHEETVWITFHPNPDDEDLDQIEKRIIEDHFNPFLGVHHSEIAHHRNHTQNYVLHHD